MDIGYGYGSRTGSYRFTELYREKPVGEVPLRCRFENAGYGAVHQTNFSVFSVIHAPALSYTKLSSPE